MHKELGLFYFALINVTLYKNYTVSTVLFHDYGGANIVATDLQVVVLYVCPNQGHYENG